MEFPGPYRAYVSYVNSIGPSGVDRSVDLYEGRFLNIPYLALCPQIESSQGWLYHQTLAKLYSRVRDNANIAVDVFEGRKTIQMLKNIRKVHAQVKRIKRSLDFTRTGRFSSGDFASAWLEYRYGWMPLVNSTYDVLDNMITHRLRNGIRVSARESCVKDDVYRGGNGSYENPYIAASSHLSERIRVSGVFWIPNSDSVFDYTTLNPALIAWELLPYSFVADWFVNVSEVLTEWENYMLLSQQWGGGYVTTTTLLRRQYTARGETQNPVIPGLWDRRELYNESSSLIKTKNRQLLPFLPQPGGFRFRPNLNAKRVLDAATLLRAAFR
nr:MAG: maturation protein [Sanya fiers-like virus 29]